MPRKPLPTIGDRIRARREAIGATTRQLAEACGWSEQYQRRIEAGRPRPGRSDRLNVAQLAKLCQALGVGPADLLDGTRETRDYALGIPCLIRDL